MDKQLVDRIKELGEILTRRVEKDFPVYAEVSEDDDYGNQVSRKVLVDYKKTEVFLHSEKDREKARKDLRKLSKKIGNQDLSDITKEEFNRYFEISRKESKESLILNIKKRVRKATGILIAGALIGASVYGVRSCVKEERIRTIPYPYTEIKMDTYDINHAKDTIDILKNRGNIFTYILRGKKWERVNLIEVYEQKIKKANKRLENLKEKTKWRLEKGYLTPRHIYWKSYKDIYGNEPWWLKEPNSINLKK